LLALVTGLSLLVAALNMFYEDVKYILQVLLYLLFYLCPIIYFSEQVRHTQRFLIGNGYWTYVVYHLNPIAMLCTGFRKVLLAPQAVQIKDVKYPPLPLDWGLLSIAIVVSFFVLWFGYHVFNKLKWQFVERP